MRSRQAKRAQLQRSECASEHIRLRNEIERLEKEAALRVDFSQSQIGLLDRRIRDMYFSVEQLGLRKQLIALHLAWVKAGNALTEAEIQDSQARVLEAQREGTLLQEVIPPAFGVLSVYVGDRIDGMLGAIAGAVVGIFVGFSYLRYKAEERQFLVNWEQSGLDDALATKRKDYPYPNRFSGDEAETGTRDIDFEKYS